MAQHWDGFSQAKGIKIWDDNASRAFLDSRGLSHRCVPCVAWGMNDAL